MQPARRGGELASAVVRTVIGTVGRVLVTVGLLILLFAVYQLWGTGIYEARAQSDLRSTFEHDLAAGDPTTTGAATTTSSPTPTTAAPGAMPVVPPEGEPVGEITIDKIGVDKIVVEGTTVNSRYPANSGTLPSPATAPRTARRSATSISSRAATSSRSGRPPARGTTG